MEIEASMELKKSILALDLQRGFQKEQRAWAEPKRMSMEKKNMVHLVSDVFYPPLSIVKRCVKLMQRTRSNYTEAVGKLLERGLDTADAIDRRLHGILDLVKVANGTAMPAPSTVSPAMLVHDAIVIVSTGNEGGLTAFSVKDTGVGIFEQHIGLVFERFWQKGSSASRGNGLGLAHAEGIVEQHGGKIRARSMLGCGSTLTFIRPIPVDCPSTKRVCNAAP